MDIEDPSTVDRHQAEELSKSKPRDSYSSFAFDEKYSSYGERRLFIVNGSSSIGDIKTRYPALSRPAAVADLGFLERGFL